MVSNFMVLLGFGVSPGGQMYSTMVVFEKDVHREAEKSIHFSFMSKSFNTQCNLTKCSILIVNEYVYCLLTGIYTNFRRLLCKKCDVRYYVIKHGVMKLMITGCGLLFQYHYYTTMLAKIKYTEL